MYRSALIERRNELFTKKREKNQRSQLHTTYSPTLSPLRNSSSSVTLKLDFNHIRPSKIHETIGPTLSRETLHNDKDDIRRVSWKRKRGSGKKYLTLFFLYTVCLEKKKMKNDEEKVLEI